MSKVAIFDQCPELNVTTESPLQGVKGVKGGENPGVILREKTFLGHLILRGNSQDESFCQGFKQAVNMELPTEPLRVNRHPTLPHSVQWISPDEWLIIVSPGTEYATELALREQLQGHFAVVNVSGGQTLLTLSGEHALAVLQKSTPYDVHPSHFPVNKGVTTQFAKATVILRKQADHVWELIVRRSFADYCYRWIVDASEEFGLDAEV